MVERCAGCYLMTPAAVPTYFPVLISKPFLKICCMNRIIFFISLIWFNITFYAFRLFLDIEIHRLTQHFFTVFGFLSQGEVGLVFLVGLYGECITYRGLEERHWCHQ